MYYWEHLFIQDASEDQNSSSDFSWILDIFSFSAGFIEDSMELLTSILSTRSTNLPNIERGFHRFQTELELYFAWYITFSMHTLLRQMTQMFLTLKSLQQQLLLPEECKLEATELKHLTCSLNHKNMSFCEFKRYQRSILISHHSIASCVFNYRMNASYNLQFLFSVTMGEGTETSRAKKLL